MRAIVKTRPEPGGEVVDIAEPSAIPAGYVLVKPLAWSICGTDVHIWHWDHWAAHRIRLPRILGHEFAGEVIAVGEGVTERKVGDVVASESHIVCGACYQCRHGQAHVCRNTRILGIDTDGVWAELVLIPEANARPTPPQIPVEIAAIQDPLGNAVHAALAGPLEGRTVAVMGCGPLGLFSIGIAKACRSSTVFAVEKHPYRLQLAEQIGADVFVNPMEEDVEKAVMTHTAGEGVDVVLEMSGAPMAVKTGFRIARPGGRVTLMGIPSDPIEVDFAEDVIFKGLEVQGIVGRRLYQTWEQMQELLVSGRLDVRPVITHRMGFSEISRAMELVDTGKCAKVILRPD
jgi:threonine 3-dehydrogenase